MILLVEIRVMILVFILLHMSIYNIFLYKIVYLNLYSSNKIIKIYNIFSKTCKFLYSSIGLINPLS